MSQPQYPPPYAVQQPYPSQPYTGQPQPCYQGQQQQSTVIINTQQQAVTVTQYGYSPMRVNCPHCQADVVTAIDYEVGSHAWKICAIITIVGLFLFAGVLLGCCLIPFCVPSCKDVVHICPNCRQTLARVPR